MSVIKPELFNSRSFIYRNHKQAEFTEVCGAAQVLNYSEQSNPSVGLVDLSVRARFGIRGSKAGEALIAAGLPLPEKANSLSISDKGIMVLRLGLSEYWLLALPDVSTNLDDLQQQLCGEGIYPVYCHDSYAWLAMAGDHLADILAKLCGVDLRPDSFAPGDVVMTSIARVGGIICHHRIGEMSVFSILSDSASSGYFWEALLDAMAEFDGVPAGQEMLMK
jgi:sarcosine oxidase subunit gamma